MRLLPILRSRPFVLFLLWTLPVLVYGVFGLVAMYRIGWLHWIAWSLPALWLMAWLAGKLWRPAKVGNQQLGGRPIRPPAYWTPQDSAAIAVVEEFRRSIDPLDSSSIVDGERYLRDARELGSALARHYHAAGGQDLLNPLTMIELLSVMHLAVEDLEEWMLKNVPGSDIATLGQIGQLPRVVSALKTTQKLAYLGSVVLNPAKLLAYPLWLKSGQVGVELQNELLRGFYQRYLRQLGFYMIEMYSGRLKGGSRAYRAQFGQLSAMAHAAGGDADILKRQNDVSTTIAVMGQVKAGKSSLINALVKLPVAKVGVLPETRQVSRYEYSIPMSDKVLALLDTPGYSEADVSRQQLREIQTAGLDADIILLVMAANVGAREADVKVAKELAQHYQKNPRLRPPVLIAVMTHIDLLRPVGEWQPPYDWRHPTGPKEESISAAVSYVKELFGDSIADFACVCLGQERVNSSSVADEIVPLLTEHLDQAHATAVLKAFYDQLSRDRLAKLLRQLVGLLAN